MVAVTSYTEAALLDFMHTELSSIGVDLGFDDDDAALVQAVTAVERALGVSDVAAATDMAYVEATARWQAWLAASAAAVGETDFKAGAATFSDSAIFDHIQTKLSTAYGFYLLEKARVASAAGAPPFFFAAIPGRRGF